MAVTVASLEAVLDLNKKNFDKKLDQSSNGLNKLVDTMAKGMVAGAAAGGAALVGLGVTALNMSNDIDGATSKLAASLGITKEEAEGFEQVMTDVFSNNFGSSFEDVAAGVGQVVKQLGRLDDKELQAVTEGIFSIADAFDKDFQETLDAQAVLMKEFGLSSQEALDFISGGFQKGLDSSDDFLDSIREYGNLFGDAGSSADEFFSVLESGAEGGVLGTDKIADAFKELNIRLNEGSANVATSLDAILGRDRVTEIAKSISAGESQWGDYFQEIVTGLQSVESDWERNRLQVELFGTMAEDLGPNFTASLSTVSTTLGELSGSTAALGEQYNNLGSAFEGIKRRAMVSLAPIGDILLNQINSSLPLAESLISQFTAKAVPMLERFLTGAVEIFTEFGVKVQETIGPQLIELSDSIGALGDGIDIVGLGLQGIQNTLDILSPSFTVLGSVISVVTGILNLADAAFEKIDTRFEAWNLKIDSASFLLGGLTDAAERVIATIFPFFGLAQTFEDISRSITEVTSGLNILSNIDLGSLGRSLPSFLRPGSPTPFEMGIRGITDSMKELPSVGDSFGSSSGTPIATGGGGGGGSINIDMGGNSFSFDNSPEGQNQALLVILQMLRSQLAATP